jgi:hypothetical protein
MTTEQWVVQATRCLSADSRATVRREILEHFEEAYDEAVAHGSVQLDAEKAALHSLGDPRQANRLYRKSLLTSQEARLLARGNREARFVCASGAWKFGAIVVPQIALALGVAEYFRGNQDLGRILFIGSAVLAVVLLAPFLPIYSADRSRVFRAVKWAAYGALYLWMSVTFGWRQSWIFYCALWPMVWIEWTRASIRRKLPLERWPRQLYL